MKHPNMNSPLFTHRNWPAILAFGALAFASLPAAQAQTSSGPNGNCQRCGTVQSVNTVQRSERPQGLAGTQVTPGMAIGGVVGGLLGNQVGHGSGRAAATVVGAAGGAYAGHQIEKNRKSYTAYVMRIRMNDGTMRTVEQRQALPRGSKVVIDGNAAHLVNARRG